MTASEAVQELTGNEGGVWQVHTRDSIHVFDLDAWTIERKPGPNAQADPSGAHAGCAPSRAVRSAREATGL
jgi:hypothetical protein